jgi:hypothetical protein
MYEHESTASRSHSHPHESTAEAAPLADTAFRAAERLYQLHFEQAVKRRWEWVWHVSSCCCQLCEPPQLCSVRERGRCRGPPRRCCLFQRCAATGRGGCGVASRRPSPQTGQDCWTCGRWQTAAAA